MLAGVSPIPPKHWLSDTSDSESLSDFNSEAEETWEVIGIFASFFLQLSQILDCIE